MHLFRVTLGWILLFTIIISFGCSNVVKEPSDQFKGHQKMVDRLSDISQNINPAQNIYANTIRAEYFLDQHKSSFGLDRVKYLGLYGQELLYAGKTVQALHILDSVKNILDTLKEKDIQYSESLASVTGIGWLRLGEERNCILNHNHRSCLLPIKEDGIHTDQEGSRNSINHFKNFLAQNKNDYTTRWLLNLAYMTIGEYPEKVPSEYLIPQTAFDEALLIPHFSEIASKIGLGETGLSGGSIAEDLDNDGYFDIVASSWGLDNQIKVYFQNGQGKFIDKTNALGLEGITGGLNMVQADYDNDGFIDIFILRGAWMALDGRQPNSLLKNVEGKRFIDVTEEVGLLSFHPTQTASWSDFDNDGDLDLFVGNESTPGCSNPCELFENDGKGHFKEIAQDVGLDVRSFIKGSIWGDYNNDGLPDLYLSNLKGNNFLFKNNGPSKNGWTFDEVGSFAGVQNPIHSFPCWFFDYNQDGWEDLFVSGYQADAGEFAKELLNLPISGELPKLYLNDRDGTFTDVTNQLGLNKILYSMGSNFGDLNNDNFPDFYVGTGDPDFRAIIPNRMFLNRAGNKFSEVTYQGGFAHLQKGHGVSFADLDRDGDQDIFTVIGGALEGDLFPNAYFDNPKSDNQWISFKLRGIISNSDAIGAKVNMVLKNGSTYSQTVNSGGSFGCNPFEIFFGIPPGEIVDKFEVLWPTSGLKFIYKNLPQNLCYRIEENSTPPTAIKVQTIQWIEVPEQHNH